MPTLRDTQQAMLHAVANGDFSAIADNILTGGLPAFERLAVYRNTFLGGLAAALRISYPAVLRLVGGDFFDGACALFIAAYPPKSAYLNSYGAEFADFLRALPQAQSLSYLADVAHLEWAVNSALHAPDIEPIALTALTDADTENLTLRPHPSVSFLRLASPADAVWRAVLAQDNDALTRLRLNDENVFLVVERRDGQVMVARADESEWESGAALAAGTPFADVFAKITPETVARLLTRHFSAGRFTALNLHLTHGEET